ncbi:MAG: hypothetical protein CHACPFDD_03740 [Phycisphaerae bacterium]|nr:hypothetical protein [Phycisphaerae bacterium]
MALTRHPAVAGRFYPDTADECARMIGSWTASPTAPCLAAVAPHAGWYYSGATAILSLSGVASYNPETVVVFGAVHVPDMNRASVYHAGTWHTPLGPLAVDAELAAALLRESPDATADPAAHAREHSVEVELPILQHALPSFHILPVMVRPGEWAPRVGAAAARAALSLRRRVAFVASTDLTHYGPSFGFEPAGHGVAGVRWARDVNDRRFLDTLGKLDPQAVLADAALHRSACGAGAVAATIAACQEFGRPAYRELRHTCSAEVEGDLARALNSVGYAAAAIDVPGAA